MNIDEKTKDTIKAHRDLQLMGICKDLHVQPNSITYRMLLVKYTLTRDENKTLCEWLKSVKFFNGYAFNISRCVNMLLDKILDMKNHNCYIYLQRLLSIAIQNSSTSEIRITLTELSIFLRSYMHRR
jgi:hypothetical protein